MADILSNTTNLSNLVPTYYSKRLLERLEPNSRAYQLAEKRTVPANSGNVILWNRYVQLDEGIDLTEGTILGPSALSTVTVSATLKQIGNVVKITDMVEMTAISNVVRDAVDVLADNAAKTIDKYILNTVGYFGSGVGAVSAFSASIHTYQFPLLYSKTSGSLDGESNYQLTSALAAGAGTITSLPMSVSAVRETVVHLRTLGVSPHEDGYFHALIHPTVANKLRGHTDYMAWNQYTRPEKMERGLIGEVEGVKFYDDANMSTINFSAISNAGVSNVGSSLGTVAGTIIFGRGAYAVTELEGSGTGDNATKVYITPRGTPDKADPLQQFGYVGYKSTLAAKILNASCGAILVTNWT
jgi:N4-gp56 family major capsid protein